MNCKNRNTLIAFCSLLLLSFSATAQVRFGVRAGAGYSSITQKIDGKYDAGARLGYSAGFLCEVPIKGHLSFRPELLFLCQGGNYQSRRYEQEAGLTAPQVKACSYGVQLPANFAYNIPLEDMRLSLLAGPVLDYSLFGDMTYGGSAHPLLLGTKETDDFQPVNFSINIGLAAEYKDLFFQVNATLGLTDRQASSFEEESALLQNNVGFSVGYFFH